MDWLATKRSTREVMDDREEMTGQAGTGQGIRGRLKERISAVLERRELVEDEELQDIIDGFIMEEGRDIYLPLKEKLELRRNLFDAFRRLGPLQELVDDLRITEIMVNGADRVFIEENGKIKPWDKSFESTEQLEDLIQKIVGRVNRMVNRSHPIVDARLEDGSRVHVVLAPLALDGPCLTIRKFPEALPMARLVANNSLTQEASEFLKQLVVAGYNIFVSGGTGSGKTTFLNALSEFLPEDDRVITIEDSAELRIRHIPNLVRLETRNDNVEGEGAIGIGQLIRASLRMNPSRIIVGEVRGSEAMDMLAAMNTGHDGSLSTGHGNSAKDMLSRLETMVLMGAELPLGAIRSQIASALDVMVHVGKLRDKSRKVLAIEEVEGYGDGEIRLGPLFRFEEEGEDPEGRVRGALKKVGELHHCEKLRAAGIRL